MARWWAHTDIHHSAADHKRRLDRVEKADPHSQAYFMRLARTSNQSIADNTITHVDYSASGCTVNTYDLWGKEIFLPPDGSHISMRITRGGFYLISIFTAWSSLGTSYRWCQPNTNEAQELGQIIIEAASQGALHGVTDNRLNWFGTFWMKDQLVNPDVGGTPAYIRTDVLQQSGVAKNLTTARMEVIYLGAVPFTSTTIL